MLTKSKTITTLAAGSPGFRNALRGLTGMASALALMAMIGAGMSSPAQAAVIISQVGSPASEGSNVLGATLTGGFIRTDWSWTHDGYGAITDTIISVTLEIDLIDAENPSRRLDLFAGVSAAGTLFGSAYGKNDGGPGPWRALPPGGTSSDNLIEISSDLFADIADGAFDIFGDNRSMIIWGSNRALLTITTEDPEIEPSTTPSAVPEPASLALFGLGLVGIGIARRRRLVR